MNQADDDDPSPHRIPPHDRQNKQTQRALLLLLFQQHMADGTDSFHSLVSAVVKPIGRLFFFGSCFLFSFSVSSFFLSPSVIFVVDLERIVEPQERGGEAV